MVSFQATWAWQYAIAAAASGNHLSNKPTICFIESTYGTSTHDDIASRSERLKSNY
ncbi:hypothetical protein O9992_12900 [Vibrio lentus]|nr:hypothetical protein [Vibrio lentus]